MDAIAEFLKVPTTEKRFSPNTIGAYRNDLRQLEKFVLDRLKADPESENTWWQLVDLALLREYIANLHSSKDYRDATVARKVGTFKSFFNFLTREGTITEAPTKSLGSPRVVSTPPRYLSKVEISRLLDRDAHQDTPEGQRDAIILELLYATGLKSGELVGLNVADIDFPNSYLRCQGKGSRNRTISLDRETKEDLRQYLETIRPLILRRHRQDALFINYRGERLTRQWIWNVIKIFGKKAGIKDLTPFTLRHSFAVHRLQTKTSFEEVQKMLGHASVYNTLTRYWKLTVRAPLQPPL